MLKSSVFAPVMPARRYAHWDTLQPGLAQHRHDHDSPAILEHARTILYTHDLHRGAQVA